MNTPPLKAILYFCTAARTLSLKAAAEQLAVTPGAVSQQIKVLEEWLGSPVFERGTRQITLTTLGNSYFKRIDPPLSELMGVSRSVQRLSQSRTLQLAVPPVIATRLIGPLLPDFFALYPNTDLRIQASSLVTDLAKDGTGIALRYLHTPDPDMDCTLLAKLTIAPTCSPDYLTRHPQMAAGNLHGCTLIHELLHPEWHRFSGLVKMDKRPGQALHFDHTHLAIQSAVQGLGIALLDTYLIQEELTQQQLVRLSEVEIPAHRHLYLVHSKELPLSPTAQAFKQWLLEQLNAADRGSDNN